MKALTQREVINNLKVKHYNQIRKLFQKQMKELQEIYDKNVTEQLEVKRQKILRKKANEAPPVTDEQRTIAWNAHRDMGGQP